MKRCRLKRYNLKIRNKMSKENKTSDKQQNGNDFIADVSGSDFWVECNVCKQQLKNWTGSTPCCGSIAYMVEDGKATTKINLFASKGGEPIKPTVIDLGKK